MTTGPDWEGNTAPRKKPWLSAVWPWIAASAFMGLMASLFFLLKGLAAFQQGTTDVGMGYMVLMALFPPVTIFAAWRSGREEPPSSKTGDPGERRWLSRLMSLMDMCGHLMPLVLLVAGGGPPSGRFGSADRREGAGGSDLHSHGDSTPHDYSHPDAVDGDCGKEMTPEGGDRTHGIAATLAATAAPARDKGDNEHRGNPLRPGAHHLPP